MGEMSLKTPILGSMKNALGYVVILIGGIVTASVSAVAYRSIPPIGLIGCVVMVLLASLFARAWLDWNGFATYTLTWLAVTFVWALEGPAGSVLIAQDALGVGWLVGAVIAIIIASVIPRKFLVGDDGAR